MLSSRLLLWALVPMAVYFSEYLQCYFVGLLNSSGAAGGSQLIPADAICRDERSFLGTLVVPGKL